MYKAQLAVLKTCQFIDLIILTCFLLRSLTKVDLNCFCVLCASMFIIYVCGGYTNVNCGLLRYSPQVDYHPHRNNCYCYQCIH